MMVDALASVFTPTSCRCTYHDMAERDSPPSTAPPGTGTPPLPAKRTAVTADYIPPRTVGGYEIIEEIGRGGMGVVYKARQPGLDRLVALKELQDVHASSPEAVQRFARESRLAGSLNHPNIVTVYQHVDAHGTSFIAMEYMPRGSLRPWIGRLSLTQLAGVLEDLLAGLAAVEPSGIVHRDLKPENVMVAADGRVKIADFGIAKATTQSASLVGYRTATGVPMGTPAYMAPEQALAQPVGPWTDLYSVGIMAYEQLVGRVPFHDSDTPVAVLLRHVNEPIPPVLDSRPELHPALSDWVARLLVKEPAARTQSAAQAWEELEEIVLELLGPRWRRDARLRERDLQAGRQSPTPTPAPAAHPQVSVGPEIESGFLSYGRAPTGVERPPRASTAHGEPAAPPTSEDQPASAHIPTHNDGSAAIPRERVGAGVSPRRARRVVVVALLAAITGAAGFALAPEGETAGAPLHNGGGAGASETGAGRAYAAALSATMLTLNAARATAGPTLAHAHTAHAQADAAQQLAHAQQQAAAAVRGIAPAPGAHAANAAIASALGDIGRGYAAMARAARSEDRGGYDRARGTVAAATTSLAVALAQLSRLGYQLGG